MKKIPHDILGNIAILKFPFEMKMVDKKKFGKRFLKEHKRVETVLEKVGKISGRLRKAKTKFIVGEKTREAEYVENGCKFRFDVDETYFSPRLAEQRKRVAEEIVRLVKRLPSCKVPTQPTLSESVSKNNQSNRRSNKFPRILVMFAGVAPWSIVIAKKIQQARKNVEIVSNEINRATNKYAKVNVKRNGVSRYVEIVGGDAKKLPLRVKGKFDFILMPRPQLKETFLKTALKLSKKGTVIYYHGFGSSEDVLEEIKRDVGKKAGKISIVKAGEIAPYKFRWLAKFKVL